MRPCRLDDGYYRIGLYPVSKDTVSSGTPTWVIEKNLSRFDVVDLPIPSRTSMVVKVEQIKNVPRPENIADLAIDQGSIVAEGKAIMATIHNLGNGKAENIRVRLLDGENVLQEKTIAQLDAPIDFVAKRTEVSFDNVPRSERLKIVVDPENTIQEILKENNSAFVFPSP